jgi:hypothetical protein
MVTFDQHANFVSTTVTSAPTPAATGTTMSVYGDPTTYFPEAPFNVIVYPALTFPTSLNTEIVRVIHISNTGQLTITRQVESSNQRSIGIGDIVSITITKKTITDIEDAIKPLTSFVTVTGSNANIGLSMLLGNSNTRYAADKGWQFYNFDTGRWHTLICYGNPPQLGFDAGDV